MAIISAQIAIANLIDSAQKGEIDPWNVPVIEVIDRVLQELGLLETELSATQADLPQSGQAFLWASMLVLLKADTLQMLQEIEPEETVEEELTENDTERQQVPPFLENHLRRRTSVTPKGKRKVTLQELIEQLEQIAAEIEATTTGETKPKPSNSRRAAMKAIANLAHNENLTELARGLENFLLKQFPQLAPEQSLNWEHLLSCWQQNSTETPSECPSPKGDRAGVFWALLLLSAQSKVELSQEEFYQDLSIRPLIHL
jgi:segregation and condensation protein A